MYLDENEMTEICRYCIRNGQATPSASNLSVRQIKKY